MRADTQVELVRRFRKLRESCLDHESAAPHRLPASEYTSTQQLANERARILRGAPTVVAFSADVPSPSTALATEADGLPLVVVRDEHGTVRVFLNACRHRGAPVASGLGAVRSVLTCPFHAWSYRLDGALHRRPGADDCFAGIDAESLSLRELPSDEALGLIVARLDGDGEVDAAAWAGTAAPDLAAYRFDRYCHIETRVHRWAFNWKLALDTFIESYHVFSLHKQTIAPIYYSSPSLFEPHGQHLLFCGVRRSIDTLGDDESTWSLLPHATISHLLSPNTLVTHQLDHIETWQAYPDGDDPNRCVLRTGIYARRPPETDKQRSYWVRNLDYLLQVTNSEDFVQCEATQQALRSGAIDEVVFGSKEPALTHFHTTLRSLSADGP